MELKTRMTNGEKKFNFQVLRRVYQGRYNQLHRKIGDIKRMAAIDNPKLNPNEKKKEWKT